MSSHLMDHSQEHPSHTENHSSQKKRQPEVEHIRNALATVHDGKISFIDFLNQILDPSEKKFKHTTQPFTPLTIIALLSCISSSISSSMTLAADRFFVAG
ncbi:hypothetical protein PAXINDRAFT_9150 [Paxillus involutus ATCC 200175]|nr:hypothetical protein PAXINDRAFT_9150 [Paxillus involutus ATCC 200175]